MATAREIAEPIRRIFTSVLPIGPGVCEICHGAPNEGFEICYSCHDTAGQVSHPLRLVVPISLSRLREQLHYVLSSYKNHRSPDIRQRFRVQVAATIALFLDEHSDCIRGAAGREWDGVAVVPSSSGRPGPHPLVDSLRLIKSWDQHLVEALRPGSAHIGHTIADDAGFEVARPVEDRSLLLIDDTFTSGARLQSAASALALAGADVVGAVVVGRVINPDYNEAARGLWDRSIAVPFSFERCCLEE